MEINKFLSKLDEATSAHLIDKVKNDGLEKAENDLPKEWGIEYYSDDDGAGKGPEMGAGDHWSEAKKALVRKQTGGIAVRDGSVWAFYKYTKSAEKDVFDFLGECDLDWENLADYDPESYK